MLNITPLNIKKADKNRLFFKINYLHSEGTYFAGIAAESRTAVVATTPVPVCAANATSIFAAVRPRSVAAVSPAEIHAH